MSIPNLSLQLISSLFHSPVSLSFPSSPFPAPPSSSLFPSLLRSWSLKLSSASPAVPWWSPKVRFAALHSARQCLVSFYVPILANIRREVSHVHLVRGLV